MIQRIQTLFLSVVAVACILLFFFPLAGYFDETRGNFLLFIRGVEYQNMMEPPFFLYFWKTFPLLLLVCISLIINIISIFSYKKRSLQLLLVNITFLLQIILIGVIFLFYTGHFEKIFNVVPSYQFGIFLPLISLIFLILANRSIRKDEILVRSADRLR